ncbi:hypothetical protein [Hamadaea tsunoensis]|uniref:hypothetical protein n=1 Tax=Hamadaea tsunoensis TaxID=53368 RepID=UPI00040B8AC0|nr:hypothetical protein [Hamadaea tsunoensis]
MTDNPSSARPAERWTALLIAGVTALAAIGGTVAAFLALKKPDHPETVAVTSSSVAAAPSSPAAAASPTVSAAPSGPVSPAASTDPAIPSGAVFLDGATPERGAGNLKQLPSAYRGKPGFEHALAVACVSPGQKYAEVVYEIRGAYARFGTTMLGVPARSGDLGARMQLWVYSDPRKDDANTQTNPPPVSRESTAGKAVPVDVSIEGVWSLRLQIRCDSTTDLVVLRDPWLLAS